MITVASLKRVSNFDPEAVCACNNSCFSAKYVTFAVFGDFLRQDTAILTRDGKKWLVLWHSSSFADIEEKKDQVIWFEEREVMSFFGEGVFMTRMFMCVERNVYTHFEFHSQYIVTAVMFLWY